MVIATNAPWRLTRDTGIARRCATVAVLAAEPYDSELRGFAPRSASSREVGAAAAAGKAAEAVVAERVAAPAGTAHSTSRQVAKSRYAVQ